MNNPFLDSPEFLWPAIDKNLSQDQFSAKSQDFERIYFPSMTSNRWTLYVSLLLPWRWSRHGYFINFDPELYKKSLAYGRKCIWNNPHSGWRINLSFDFLKILRQIWHPYTWWGGVLFVVVTNCRVAWCFLNSTFQFRGWNYSYSVLNFRAF